MLNFLLLMVVPIAIALGTLYFWRREVNVGEFAALLAIPAIVVLIGLGIARWQSTTDVEILNGRISSKVRERVSCEHSYSCNCRTVCSGSGKNESCSTTCDTCYEHSYDIDWVIYSTIGTRTAIDRIDRRGLDMPPRWGVAYLGEPFAASHSYTNYILANPDSVLLGGKGDVKRFASLIPPYPSNVWDYYRAQHVLNAGGAPVADWQSWEWLLREVNGDLGPMKQVNIIVLFVKTADPAYTLALKDAWVGGKKNDVVVVIGTLDGKKMEFVDVVSWTPKFIYKIELRDTLYKIGSLDRRDDIVSAICTVTVGKYERMHMSDYKYLLRSFQPSSMAMVMLFILATALAIGFSVWSVTNDINADGKRIYNYGYRYRR
jgi:hypothetical protein